MIQRLFLGFVLVLGLSLLAACDSAEERAEKHFQAALEHIENGDVDRAIIEFRNVFKLNGRHKEARLTYAKLQRERGAIPEAYGQYLRLVEQYPDNLEGRLALTELAFETGSWDEVERHGKAAAELAPDEPVARAALIALDYRAATQSRDSAEQQAAVDKARALLDETPGLISARQLVVNHLVRQQKWQEAREELDAAIASAPHLMDLYTLRLGVLNELGDTAAIEAQFQKMLTQFPEDRNVRALLLNWYMSQGDVVAAEAFLRDQIAAGKDSHENRLALVRLITETRGNDAALAELDRIIAANTEHRPVFRSLRAAVLFEKGESDTAISEMEELLAGAEPSPETNDIRVTFARMLFATGNAVGARAEVEEVLETDRSHVEALKLKAGWLIDDDQTGEAIVILREALGHSPRDPQLMTLLAQAHERDGNRDLMAEMLALAVEASGSAPGESLRYATYLTGAGKDLAAEDVLLDALRLQPENRQLLGTLGSLYIRLQDWPRAQGVIDRLNRIEDGTVIANELNARKLAAQGQEGELTRFLETLAAESDGIGAEIGLIRAHAKRGDMEAALDAVDRALQETPDNAALRFVRGAVLAMSSRFDDAEAVYRELFEETPGTEQVWLALYRLELIRGEPKAATQVLDEALAALPDSTNLQWAKAVELEQSGDVDGAIAIYDALYEKNSGNLIVANNLASLLATHRDDNDSLERAWRIARRLRGSDIPAFQDTFGWIAYRRGDLDAALTHLEPAAEKLADDPVVQYHLAATYAALDRNTDALAQFRKVAGMEGTHAIIDTVNAEIARLSSLAGGETQVESSN